MKTAEELRKLTNDLYSVNSLVKKYTEDMYNSILEGNTNRYYIFYLDSNLITTTQAFELQLEFEELGYTVEADILKMNSVNPVKYYYKLYW